MDAGFRKNNISLLRDMVMQMAPITIRNRLNRANIAAATLRSDQRRKVLFKTMETWEQLFKNIIVSIT